MRKRSFLLTGGLVLLLACTLLILLNRKPVTEQDTTSEANADFQAMRADAAAVEEEGGANADAESTPEEPEPIHYTESGMDPADQPRAFYQQDFKPGELPEGFELHNVRLTERGFELEPGEAGQPRVGMVQSPPMPFDFNSNAFAPMWVEDLPEGTSVLVEVAVSPDGENWGMWHQADVDHDSYGQVSEFYPDGSPNPNYGYTPGGNFIWGDMTWKYFRYNIALYSETGESPSVSSFRGFYQDSTLEQGKLAELDVPEEKTASPEPAEQ